MLEQFAGISQGGKSEPAASCSRSIKSSAPRSAASHDDKLRSVSAAASRCSLQLTIPHRQMTCRSNMAHEKKHALHCLLQCSLRIAQALFRKACRILQMLPLSGCAAACYRMRYDLSFAVIHAAIYCKVARARSVAHANVACFLHRRQGVDHGIKATKMIYSVSGDRCLSRLRSAPYFRISTKK